MTGPSNLEHAKHGFAGTVIVFGIALMIFTLSDTSNTRYIYDPQPYEHNQLQQVQEYGQTNGHQNGEAAYVPKVPPPPLFPVTQRPPLPTGYAFEIQVQRTEHVKRVCTNHSLPSEIGSRRFQLVYSEKHKLAYFDIPKIGSTFFKQMFLVLQKGPDKANEIYSTMRAKIHLVSGGLYKKLDAKTLQDTLVMLPTRNPYSRLYSAYVDKAFLPIQVSLSSTAATYTGNTSPCGVDLTFREFLKYALSSSSRILANHYNSPYKAMAHAVCRISKFVLVQQESFSSDIEFALRRVGVNGTEYDTIREMLHGHRVEATIPGIVKTIYDKSKKYWKSCFPTKLVAKRTWKSFQIQGYLSNDFNFPENEFQSSLKDIDLYADPDHLIYVVLKYIKKKSLSSEESKAQRKAALLEEYKTVDNNLIKLIQQRYAMDFEMFQYNLDVNAIS